MHTRVRRHTNLYPHEDTSSHTHLFHAIPPELLGLQEAPRCSSTTGPAWHFWLSKQQSWTVFYLLLLFLLPTDVNNNPLSRISQEGFVFLHFQGIFIVLRQMSLWISYFLCTVLLLSMENITLSSLSCVPWIPFNHMCQVFIFNMLHWSVRVLRDKGGMEEEGRPRGS